MVLFMTHTAVREFIALRHYIIKFARVLVSHCPFVVGISQMSRIEKTSL